MRFLCIDCDRQMAFEDRQEPGDGTFAASFVCPGCGRRMAMLANPMETQVVGSLGVKVGGRTLDQQPMELVRQTLEGRDDAFEDVAPPGRPQWAEASEERLARVPGFVRGMVKKIYTEWAQERDIEVITPAVMDEARIDLGLEEM